MEAVPVIPVYHSSRRVDSLGAVDDTMAEDKPKGLLEMEWSWCSTVTVARYRMIFFEASLPDPQLLA